MNKHMSNGNKVFCHKDYILFLCVRFNRRKETFHSHSAET